MLIFMLGLLSSNSIFSVIHAQNPELLGLKWKLRTWGFQKCPNMSQQLLPNWSYKPLNVNGRFFWDTLYLVTLEGKLTEPGDLQISKLGKNFFSKVYLYDTRDIPPNDLGLITPKCIFWISLIHMYHRPSSFEIIISLYIMHRNPYDLGSQSCSEQLKLCAEVYTKHYLVLAAS